MARRKQGRIITAENAPRVWTGDALLDRMLELAGFTGKELRNALARTVEALDAETPTKRILTKGGGEMVIEGGPDHYVRLKAAENLFDWVGFKGKREREGGTGKPVQVTINLTAAPEPRTVIPNGRVKVHLALDGPANGSNGTGH
jgi:hypothetical protein